MIEIYWALLTLWSLVVVIACAMGGIALEMMAPLLGVMMGVCVALLFINLLDKFWLEPWK